jgi:hypothetical protein
MERRASRVSLNREVLALSRRFPQSSVRRAGRALTWRGNLRPSVTSRTYLVEVKYRLGGEPVTRVIQRLETRPGLSLPHVWNHARQVLCLHERRDWRPGMLLADSIVPWASEWLFFYEFWLVTGNWDGGGRWQPPPSPESGSGPAAV